MKSLGVMNRTGTKYVTNTASLMKLLAKAKSDYLVQDINGMRLMPYSTSYYDTSGCDMYIKHLHGHKTRQKIRVRTYVDSGVSFLEIKNKNNKGRTEKKRISYYSFEDESSLQFIGANSAYLYNHLQRRIDNQFSRITLVNRQMTERLTIDTNLQFCNLHTGIVCTLEGLVIIELKRDGNTFSPVSEMLRQLRIHPNGFSKYCMGMALTDERLKQNRFKPRLRNIYKMCHVIQQSASTKIISA